MNDQTDIQQILSEVTIEDNTVKLNCGDLGPLYKKVDEVLKRLWGKWNGRKRLHIFQYDPTDAIAEYVKSGKLPPKNATAYFPTPDTLVDDMIEEVHGWPSKILEPSAGQGAIALKARERWTPNEAEEGEEGMGVCFGPAVDCVEMLDINASVLEGKGFEVTRADFLTIEPRPVYDLVLMNPPFSVKGDALAFMTHIYHAFKFLKPKGELIAIMPTSWKRIQQSNRFDAFRDFMAKYSTYIEIYDKGTFKDSGTMVETCMVHFEVEAFEKYKADHDGSGSKWEWRFGLVHDGSYGSELSRQANPYMPKSDYVAFVARKLVEDCSEFLLSDLLDEYVAYTDEAIEKPKEG